MTVNPNFEMTVDLDPKAIRELATSRQIEDGLLILGQVGEASAKRNAPVDTGTLRRSITHELNRQGIQLTVRIGTNIRYAIFQEIGTIIHAAHPYLRPALADIQAYIRRGGSLQ